MAKSQGESERRSTTTTTKVSCVFLRHHQRPLSPKRRAEPLDARSTGAFVPALASGSRCLFVRVVRNKTTERKRPVFLFSLFFDSPTGFSLFFLRPSRRGLSPTAAPPSFRSSEDVAGCISTQEERSADQAMSSLVRSARPGRFAGKTRRWLRPVGRPRPGGHSSIFALLASICRPIQLTSLDGQHTHTPSLLMSVAALGGVDRGGNERARSSYRSNEDLLFGVATLATPAPSMLLLPPLSTIWPGPLFFSSSAGAPCLVGRRVANPCSLGD